jgi:hypothetical protein
MSEVPLHRGVDASLADQLGIERGGRAGGITILVITGIVLVSVSNWYCTGDSKYHSSDNNCPLVVPRMTRAYLLWLVQLLSTVHSLPLLSIVVALVIASTGDSKEDVPWCRCSSGGPAWCSARASSRGSAVRAYFLLLVQSPLLVHSLQLLLIVVAIVIMSTDNSKHSLPLLSIVVALVIASTGDSK